MKKTKPKWQAGYKEARNLIHNEVGLTKENLQDVFREIAREEINTILGQNGEFIRSTMRDVIRDEMILAVNDGKYPDVHGNTYYYDRNNPKPFQDYISGILKQEVINSMKTQFDVGVQITQRPAPLAERD